MRIYCLTSIIVKNASSNSLPKIKDNEFFYPENSTKIVMEKIKSDPKIFNSYQLTEICIGYHFISQTNKKVYLLLLYRKDTKLIVIKMVPGSVSFHSITNQVFEFNISTSKLFSNLMNFDLVIRVRCIKNTQVRGCISEDEIRSYENFATEIETFSKNEPDLQETAFGIFSLNLPNQSSSNVLRTKISDINTIVKLLCDPETGNVENVPEKGRYNQKVKCLWAEQKSSTNFIQATSSNLLYQDKMDENTSNIPIVNTQTNLPPKIDVQLNKTIMEEEIKIRKNRGRPKAYSTEIERRKARVEASKKYSRKKDEEKDKIKEDVILLEELNQNLIEQFKNLKNNLKVPENLAQKFPNEFIDRNILNESPENSSSIFSSDGIQSEKIKKDTKVKTKESLSTISKKSIDDTPEFKHLKRREQQRLAVQRARERKKMETELLEKKKELCRKENDILRKQIESIETLMKWMKDMVDAAQQSKKSNTQNDDKNNSTKPNAKGIRNHEKESLPSASKISPNSYRNDYLFDNQLEQNLNNAKTKTVATVADSDVFEIHKTKTKRKNTKINNKEESAIPFLIPQNLPSSSPLSYFPHLSNTNFSNNSQMIQKPTLPNIFYGQMTMPNTSFNTHDYHERDSNYSKHLNPLINVSSKQIKQEYTESEFSGYRISLPQQQPSVNSVEHEEMYQITKNLGNDHALK